MDFFMQNILIIVCLFPLLGVALIVLLPRDKGKAVSYTHLTLPTSDLV